MKNLSLIALIAAGVFALYTAPSFAASTIGAGPTPPCTFNCNPPPGGDTPPPGGDPTEPGDPFLPPECLNCGPGGGDTPPPGEDVPPPGDDVPPPGEDVPPPGDDVPPPGDGTPGDGSGLTEQQLAELRACLVRLESLPQVSESEIKGFSDPSKVSLIPVCETKSLTESDVAIIDKGNTLGLEDDIKANELMRTKLGMTAYKARDVVGIDFDEKGNAILFVHKRG